MPTDRVHCPPRQAQLRTVPPDTPKRQHQTQPHNLEIPARLRTRGATPDPSRYTRSVALHPIRRGVMPTDRVHRLPQQVQLRTVALRSHTPGLFHEGHARGTAPVPSRCTRSVALHPFRRAAPVTSRCTRSEGVQCLRIGCNTSSVTSLHVGLLAGAGRADVQQTQAARRCTT